ncbi:DUF3795 domain-containing protein [Methanospirillum lacunae]|uniref:DUF3795 domain-containing protein n=1 Tax=Methanospirillum lacunae TaxID=668570 RepID=A0A2V2NAN4_9EURY|nr:DUF3795 domain-containing protein [Methanospirillum lacunae]PWR72621.1 hypothetical protein DK846_06550 [Methanospirillum lacunae]
MNSNLTSFCGLCCSDCIPSDSELFSLIDSLDKKLQDIQFEQYAELKSETNEHFNDYSTFLVVLDQIRKLKCNRPCQLEGGKPNCTIRVCAGEKGFSGCWECENRKDCTLLDRLRTIHPHIDEHLDLINRVGPSDWFDMRKEHYRWQVVDRRDNPSD